MYGSSDTPTTRQLVSSIRKKIRKDIKIEKDKVERCDPQDTNNIRLYIHALEHALKLVNESFNEIGE